MKIIDVRTIAEFNSGHAPGSINIPLSEIAAKVEEIKNMNQRIILCCASGNRSGQACLMLEPYGFKDVINVAGGMLAWQEQFPG